MKDTVDYSNDPLQTACQLAIAGNDIDLGAQATILSQCSSKMLSYYQSADVIISKGQGNYESLNERSENIFFLFTVKCSVIARDSDFAIGSSVLIHSQGNDQPI